MKIIKNKHMNNNRSTRHSKITGDFGEGIVLYLLSKSGFESANVDHTGIDIISYNHENNTRMGISVKSRSRKEGKEGTSVSIESDNFLKAEEACKAFGCVPYFAIVCDENDRGGYIFILSMLHLLKICKMGKNGVSWKMSKKNIEEYLNDNEIKTFKFSHEKLNWW